MCSVTEPTLTVHTSSCASIPQNCAPVISHCLLSVIYYVLVAITPLQALLFLFLLPVAAVALTLTILTINVDPTGPSLILSMHSIEQFSPIPLSNNPAPAIISGCIEPTGFASKEVAQTIYNGWVPKYQGVERCPDGLYFLVSLGSGLSV